MSSYRIELSLDGTTLRASLLDADHWCMEISGDSVDLAPLINAARAEGMREAARISYGCPDYVSRMDVDEFGVLPPGSPYDQGRHDAMKAILSAIGGQK